MKTLELRGEKLQCVDGGVTLDIMFELSEVSGGGADPMRTMLVLSHVLYSLIVPEEHERFRSVLRTMKVADIDELGAAVGGLLAAETDRPTERPSDLPAGSAPTGGPLRVVSFSPATAPEEPRSSRAGRRNAS